MDSNIAHDAKTRRSPARVLVVADWSVDARAVIEACERRNRDGAASFALVVPAWLHGIDWAGDPHASVPCAHRQLDSVIALARVAGRAFDTAAVGDAEPVTAMCDGLADWPADEVLICSRPSRVVLPHPFDLEHRARRVSGLPVTRAVLPPTPGRNGRPARRRAGHCEIAQPLAAS